MRHIVPLLVVFCSMEVFCNDTASSAATANSSFLMQILGNKKSTIKSYSKRIGMGFGFISGNGIMYRRDLSKTYSLQLTGLPFYYEKNYKESNETNFHERTNGYSHVGYFSFGVLFSRLIARESEFNFAYYTGMNSTVTYEKSDYWEFGTHTIIRDKQKEFSVGTGLSGEVQMWRFFVNMGLGVRGYYDINTHDKGIVPSIDLAAFFGY